MKIYSVCCEALANLVVGKKICLGFMDITIAIHGMGFSFPCEEYEEYSAIFFQWHSPTIRIYHSRYRTLRTIELFHWYNEFLRDRIFCYYTDKNL